MLSQIVTYAAVTEVCFWTWPRGNITRVPQRSTGGDNIVSELVLPRYLKQVLGYITRLKLNLIDGYLRNKLIDWLGDLKFMQRSDRRKTECPDVTRWSKCGDKLYPGKLKYRVSKKERKYRVKTSSERKCSTTIKKHQRHHHHHPLYHLHTTNTPPTQTAQGLYLAGKISLTEVTNTGPSTTTLPLGVGKDRAESGPSDQRIHLQATKATTHHISNKMTRIERTKFKD